MEAISAKNYVSFIGIQTQCIEVELSHHCKCMCTIASREQFKPIRMGGNLVVSYNSE